MGPDSSDFDDFWSRLSSVSPNSEAEGVLVELPFRIGITRWPSFRAPGAPCAPAPVAAAHTTSTLVAGGEEDGTPDEHQQWLANAAAAKAAATASFAARISLFR